MIGKKIRERRLELGLTQEELAHRMGYKSKSTINKIEKDLHDVNQTNLIKLSKALDCSPSFFIETPSHIDRPSDAVMMYAEKLANLPPEQRDNVFSYIDFLMKE
jgi:transcriptional regulator with XRE-family HTH domain